VEFGVVRLTALLLIEGVGVLGPVAELVDLIECGGGG
jgi:hypothetical protein